MKFSDRYALLTTPDKLIIGINLAAALLNFGTLWMVGSLVIAGVFFYVITNINATSIRGRVILSQRQYQDMMKKTDA